MRKKTSVNNKNILILHTSTVKGGAEFSLFELIDNWKNMPIEIYLAWSSSPFSANQFPPNTKLQDVHIPYLKKTKNIFLFLKSIKTILLVAVSIWNIVRKEKIQVLYCNTFRTLPFCFLASRLSHVPVVCHCRDNVPFFLHIFTYIINVKFIAVSSSIFKQLPEKKHSYMIHNGINTSLFPPDINTDWLYKKYNLPKQIKLIGNIGAILPWKNQLDYVLVALNILKENSNLHFFIIGEVLDKSYFLTIKKKIKNAGFESNFTFTGHVDEIRKYYRCFSVVIHTAINEPFGRVLAESGASNIPVIAYDSGGISEIIINNVTGCLVPEKDIDKMTNVTATLLTSDELRFSMGLSAREHVISKFSSEDCAIKVYECIFN